MHFEKIVLDVNSTFESFTSHVDQLYRLKLFIKLILEFAAIYVISLLINELMELNTYLIWFLRG